MAERIVCNLAHMTEAVGGRYVERPVPDGSVMAVPTWDGACYERALAELSKWKEQPDNDYFLTDVPAPWILIALVKALEPCRVRYLYMREDGVEVDISRLARGNRPKEENFDVVFEVIERGDDLFINMNSDHPVADIKANGGPHTFDIANLPKVVIPEIPAGKHIYFHAKGRYCVMDVIALNFLENAKSLSIACHDEDYFCAYTTDPSFLKVGDVTKRTVENRL